MLMGSAETPRGNSRFGVARLPNGSCIVLLQGFVWGGGGVGPSAIWLLPGPPSTSLAATAYHAA